MKKFFVLAAAAMLCGGCNCLFSKPEQPAALLTYNIHIGLQADHQTRDLAFTAGVIKQINAETVVLNEVDVNAERSGKTNQPQIVAEAAGYDYVIFGKAFQLPDGEYGNAIMSKYPLEQIALLNIPANATESRSALVVKVNAPKPYYVIGTHLAYEESPEMEEVRVKALQVIGNYIKDNNLTPAVLMGDMNATPDGKAITALRELGFQVFNDSVPGELSYSADNPYILLDYQAIYPADSAELITHYVVEETKASDHRPVYSKILLK